VLANYVFSAETQALVPTSPDRRDMSRPPTRFLVLRDGTVYFQGSDQEFTRSPDPYLRKYLA